MNFNFRLAPYVCQTCDTIYSMSKWVVITSINPPQERYSSYTANNWNVVVVGDLKTNDKDYEAWVSESNYYLSTSSQEKLFPKLSNALGFNTYARKNLGYLYAISMGATVIWETDDDTFMRLDSKDPLELFSSAKQYSAEGISKVFNPYGFFAPKSGLWPRGFPLRKVAEDRKMIPETITIREKSFELDEVDLIQTLVNLEPDVDAIHRLVFGDDILDFPFTNQLILLEEGLVSPGNTQSTFWISKKSFPYLYIPRTVDFRFCDILKSYIAQANLTMAHGGFLVDQVRNPHDYLEDFRLEVSCYLNTELAIEITTRLSKQSIFEIYQALIFSSICEARELEILSLFLDELRKLGVEVEN